MVPRVRKRKPGLGPFRKTQITQFFFFFFCYEKNREYESFSKNTKMIFFVFSNFVLNNRFKKT